MSTQRLRYLMIIFCSISTVRSQEPCSSTVYRTIGGEDRRSVDYQFDINMDLAYSDDRLPDPAEWFRIVNIAGEDMPTSSPGTFRCGTWYPIWLNGQLPEAGVTTTQPVCLQTFKNECEHTWNIEVRNCSGLYYVYKLKQSPIIDSAYCFGRSTICPAGTSSDTGYTPDCRSYNTNITISAMVVPDLVKGSVYIPVFHDYNLEPVFKCHFDNPGTIYYYDIEWYINEISIKGDTNTLYGSNDTILRPRHWEASYDMNMLVKCAVRVRAGNGTLPSPRMYSPNYVAGIVIERYSYVVDEGQSVAISFTVTVPIGCNAPQLLNSCKETIKVSYPKVDSCQSSSHSGNPIVEETCGADINAAGWSVDRVHTLKVYGNIDNRYNSESVRYATLSLSKVQSGKDPSKAWDNVIIPDISISIRDGDTQLSGMECISQTDPSYRTFDWNWYSAQISGEHVLYKHKREPYRVHTLTSGCYWGSCNVGIAIRSHDSLFVVRTVDEVYNPIRLDNTDSDFRATFTSRTYPLIDRRDCDDRNLRISRSGKEFTVALPSGTEIFFRIKFDQSSFHDLLVVNNINIKPSVLDIDQTEGLCGFLNFDSTDDFTDANGTVVDRNQFVNSWSIPSNSVDSLFSTSPQFTNDQFYKKPFCVCGEEASGNVPIGDDFNTVHCNLTQPMEQCYNSQAVSGGSLYTTCSKIHKRNTDQSDEVVDIVPLKYAENFEERYIPPEIQWRSGWTEQLAREECLNAFTNFTALDVCKEFANLKTDEFVEPCITDIKATGGTTLLEGTITTMISSCITEVSRNETLMTSSSTNPSNETSITDSPVTGVTTLLDEIKSQLCINNCSNNGICDIAGICKCYPGFIGEQCSIAETLPPQKISVPGDGLCGTRSRSCTRTFINGVYESDNVWCKLTFFTLINNEKQISSPSIVVKGSYHGFTSISCPLTPSSRRRKRSVTLLPVEGYQISLSYDGTNFGDEVSIIIYDESCYSCNGTAGICVVLDSCPLFATTTATEYIRENDKSSQVNKFSSTTENWHRIPTSIHLTTQENIETSQTTKESMSTENVDIQTTQHSTTIKDVDTSKTKYLMTTGNADVVPTTPHSFANVETIFTSMDSISKQKETEVQITKQTKADPNVETVQTTEHLLTDEITYTQIDITTKIFPVKDTTTDESTTEVIPTTVPVQSTTSCAGDGTLNRTNAGLNRECGAYSGTGKCIISHSACTEISKTWQCKCVQGYAEKSGQCVKMPNGLFKDIDRTRTVSVSENAGESVLNVIFSEINGFESITNQEAKIVGSDAEHFEIIYPIQSRFLIKTKTKLTMLKYEITVIVSVQIDNVIVRDHVHIIVNVIRSTSDITRKTLVVLDGTLSGSTIGFICTSCIKQAVLYPKQDIFSVENDGSVNTTKNIDLDSLIGETTITYSKQYNITNKNDPSVVLAIIDLVITRRMFTKQLPDVSKIDTKVGQFDLHDKLKIENLGDTGFTINSDNYLLLGTNRLEYAESQKVEKTLQISIGDVSFNIEVEIEVLDANNNPPSFPENNEYNFKMIQSVYPDLIVGFVKAEDKDTKSRIFYTISPNDKLKINNDGVISIKSAFSTNENYTVKITASDGLYSEDVDVIFEIIPGVEQNLNKSFTGMVNENRSPGTFVTTASASGYKAYSFADYTARTNFKIDSNTGLITTVKELDREQQDRYRYTIVAHKNDTQSCTLVVIGEVTIRIGDVNDEPPVFAHPFYNATVPENETSTSLTMHVLISTTDKDINPSVLYSVVSPSDKFSINSITGEIKTIRVLDRETDPTYEITVRANDSVNSATATVTVQVLDKNDNEPKFSRHVPGFSVSENASIGTVVISISANDSDEGKNAEITYDLDSPGGFFKIDQTTGEIKLLRELDREKSPIHYITVYARDNGDNILSSTSTLTVTVTDINDNSPKFNLSEMTVSVEENNDCTTAILKLNATDADEDNTQNSQITYTIVSNDQDITIDNNGVLKCRQSFDFEQQRSHTVVIRASDNGKPPLFAEQNVTVNINDVNDNQPEFKKQLTNLTIRYVNGGSSISQIVEIVSATDRDSGENGMVTYNMSGTAASFLNIDPDRGIIRTNKGMVPINQQYTLTVIVKDKGDPPKQTSSNINVNFQAIQTQPVKFNQELLEFTISENNAIGNRIGSIRNNVLHPSGTNVLFEIIDTVSVTAFSINASTGIITSSLTLDREVQDNHEFVVKVKNSVNGEQSDLSVIRVEVEDENDEKPVFGRVQDYTYTISEHLDTGAHATADVEEITASDADIGNNAIIDFKIEDGGDCIKKFKLTTMAENKMAVSLNENVDYEKMKSCTFLVTAFNRYEPQMNSTVRAVVRIMDYNDNDPVFEGHTNNEYDIDIPEDTTINSEPIVIGRVTDADDRENKDVELKISDDCWFNSIKDDEQFSLKLKPSQTLDYDDGPITNKCVITANDKAKDENLRRSATATVNIRITDVNDNPPVFDKKKKYVNVPRDEEIDFIITTVVATDRDSGSNGNITYSLRNSAHSASFTINPSTGALKINAPLIAIEKDKITLTIIATDKGSPLLSDTMQVEINITDENPRPFFTKSGSVEIQEHNTLPDGLIEQVVAYDRKSGIVEICDCIYYIDTKRDDIFIERNTGKIKFKSVNGTLDREKETNGRVQFAVIAQDKDNPPKNSSNIGFVIEIKDINDNTPAFKNPELSFAFPQNAPDGYVFGKVHAEDPDVNPKTFYSINLTQAGDNLKTDVVHINQETGELTKHGNTTLTFTQDAKIEGFVAAWDSEGDTNSTSYARIIIKVEFDDKNKHTPTFDRNTYTGEIRWDSKAEKSILQVNATDLDKDVQGEVHYSIVNGNTRGFFNVDKDGVVYLQYLLDSSIGTGNRVTVNLTIKAEDRGIIPKYSHANVRVVITGINPGVCIQESDHNKQVVDLETERNSWSNALYGLVAALCVSIIVCCVLLYKWRTSIPSSGGEPFYKRDKQYAENPEYDDLSRRQTVQYSQSNQAFDPPAPHLDFHPGKDEYTRIEENTGETSPFRMSDIEESPDYTPEERRRHMPPAAYSFNPNYLTS